MRLFVRWCVRRKLARNPGPKQNNAHNLACYALRAATRGNARGNVIGMPMQITSGRVIAGHVELDSELPEGTAVTVLVPEADETFEAGPELERILLQSIAQCEEGRTVSLETVLA